MSTPQNSTGTNRKNKFLFGKRRREESSRRSMESTSANSLDVLNIFPIKSAQELEDLEKELKRSDIGKRIVKMFDPEKGEEVYEYTHRIMKKLLTPEVASGYNLTGRNSKKKFQDLELYKVVVETAEIHAKTLYTKDITTEIGTWLSSASRKSNKSS
ncbi:protein of unknown function (DUF4806) [Popillia japonica]|uniref:DUF4806 domain-containing protein n=1 Tax=Popillia japonica TaxID=7064 RepID=A0AAW1JJT7_POPJA